ncbi:MAG TPA: MoaD/ThiS family protein [Opitutaceae bacterium]|nr:MoaD/ThiS family protein [Opitutaceae bacterium]
MIRVLLPFHLRTLAGATGEVQVDVVRPATLAAVIAALETKYPMLRGTIRDRETGKRRLLVRFYACEKDFSHEPLETTELPAPVVAGEEPLLVVGAIAGG